MGHLHPPSTLKRLIKKAQRRTIEKPFNQLLFSEDELTFPERSNLLHEYKCSMNESEISYPPEGAPLRITSRRKEECRQGGKV